MYGISIHPLWFLHHISLLKYRDYQCRSQYRILPHHPRSQLATTPPPLWADEIRMSPQLHFLPKLNLLAHYVKEKDTPLIDFLLFSSYAI
jgi:hypothetical protein